LLGLAGIISTKKVLNRSNLIDDVHKKKCWWSFFVLMITDDKTSTQRKNILIYIFFVDHVVI